MSEKYKNLYLEQMADDTVDRLWHMSVGTALDMQAERLGDRLCITDAGTGETCTYRELSELTDRMAANLAAIGIRRGDRVGVYALNSVKWVSLMFALGKLGAGLVALNTGFKSMELKNALMYGSVRMLIFDDGTEHNPFPEIVDSLDREELEDLEILMYMGTREDVLDREEILPFERLTKEPEERILSRISRRKFEIEAHETACIIFTSGSTAAPKGVELTHLGILNVGKTTGYKKGLDQNDLECIPVPLFHCFGMILGVLSCIGRGAGMVMIDRFSEIKVLEAVQKYRCTSLLGVATMFSRMIYHPEFEKYDMSSLRTGIVGGAACATELAYDILNKMHMRDVTFGCGLTEDCGLAVMADHTIPFEYRIGIVGTDMPHVENRLVDINTGEEAGYETVGEMYTRGYNVMKGYCGKPDLTRQVLDDDGWLRTGDLYIRHRDGNYKMVGRCKEMIIRGGENIYPSEIENVLTMHPAVQCAAVVGVPDRKYGESVAAFVVVKNGKKAEEKELIEHVRSRIASYKKPQYVFQLDQMPMTENQKINKVRLRKMAEELTAGL